MGGTIANNGPAYQTDPQIIVGGSNGPYAANDVPPPDNPQVDMWEQARLKADIGEGFVGLRNLQKYRAAIEDSFLQPVISVRALADVVVQRAGLPSQLSEVVEQQIALDHPSGLVTPLDFVREVAARPIVLTFQIKDAQLRQEGARTGRDVSELQQQMRGVVDAAINAANARVPRKIEYMVARMTGENIDAFSIRPRPGFLSQNRYQDLTSASDLRLRAEYRPEDVDADIQLLKQVVAMHNPGQQYASYASRSYAENAEAAQDPRIKSRNTTQDFYLTEDGAQNHQSLRVSELWSAGDPDYFPGQNVSQVARFAAGVLGPLINYARGVVTTPEEYQANFRPLEDMGQMMTDNGKYGYAADLYQKAGQGGEFEQRMMYARDGTPKYYTYDPTNFMGIGTMMDSPTFWYGRAYNNTAPIREAALEIGNDMEMGSGGVANLSRLLRKARDQGKRITPLVPDNMTAEQHQNITSDLLDADTRMAGMMSATYGPKMSDMANAMSLGGGGTRTYMSPVMQAVLSAPAESISDPLNLGINLGRGALTGLLTSAAKNTGKSAAAQLGRATMGTLRGIGNSPFYVGDDIVEETLEAAPAGGALGGMSFFEPEKYNLLMGDADPNEEGFDERVEEAHIQARMDQMDAARRFGKALGIPTERPKRKPQGMIEPPIPQFR